MKVWVLRALPFTSEGSAEISRLRGIVADFDKRVIASSQGSGGRILRAEDYDSPHDVVYPRK